MPKPDTWSIIFTLYMAIQMMKLTFVTRMIILECLDKDGDGFTKINMLK